MSFCTWPDEGGCLPLGIASPGPNPDGNDEGEGAGASLGEGALLSEPLPPASTNKTTIINCETASGIKLRKWFHKLKTALTSDIFKK